MNAILIVTLFFLLNKSTKTVNKDDNGVDRANNDDAKRNGGGDNDRAREVMVINVDDEETSWRQTNDVNGVYPTDLPPNAHAHLHFCLQIG